MTSPAGPAPDHSEAPTAATPTDAVTAATTGTRTRASDAERERVVTRLHHAVGEGRLDLTEAEERTAAAYAARFRDELDPLLVDLPGGPAGAEPWSAIWESVVWRGHRAVWGPEAGRPTAPQCRTAVAVLAAAVVWVLLCMVVGAVVVAA
ncbi:hypothetical protein GCM10010472_60630 [Pseudonocardia halophobica]|uniref:DUF1707 domain-containing protein n=1 Tax=Pseudonocardia halophobica TaxID=29401 RepID=A0A9W6UGE9_9PSEU|nr:DUF1707 domain-containing protein [Pseudonocardia halophobica]GLL15984.1 hypothetical protein GCM10017577_71380 [Pseudonocardia halophobica]